MVPKDDEPADVRGHVCNYERKPSGDPIGLFPEQQTRK